MSSLPKSDDIYVIRQNTQNRSSSAHIPAPPTPTSSAAIPVDQHHAPSPARVYNIRTRRVVSTPPSRPSSAQYASTTQTSAQSTGYPPTNDSSSMNIPSSNISSTNGPTTPRNTAVPRGIHNPYQHNIFSAKPSISVPLAPTGSKDANTEAGPEPVLSKPLPTSTQRKPILNPTGMDLKRDYLKDDAEYTSYFTPSPPSSPYNDAYNVRPSFRNPGKNGKPENLKSRPLASPYAASIPTNSSKSRQQSQKQKKVPVSNISADLAYRMAYQRQEQQRQEDLLKQEQQRREQQQQQQQERQQQERQQQQQQQQSPPSNQQPSQQQLSQQQLSRPSAPSIPPTQRPTHSVPRSSDLFLRLPMSALVLLVLNAKNAYAGMGFAQDAHILTYLATYAKDAVRENIVDAEDSNNNDSDDRMRIPNVTGLYHDMQNHSARKKTDSSSDGVGSKADSRGKGSHSSNTVAGFNEGQELLLLLPVLTSNEVEKRFKQLALRLHPDKCKHPLASDAFNRLKTFSAQLADVRTRYNCDRQLWGKGSAMWSQRKECVYLEKLQNGSHSDADLDNNDVVQDLVLFLREEHLHSCQDHGENRISRKNTRDGANFSGDGNNFKVEEREKEEDAERRRCEAERQSLIQDMARNDEKRKKEEEQRQVDIERARLEAEKLKREKAVLDAAAFAPRTTHSRNQVDNDADDKGYDFARQYNMHSSYGGYTTFPKSIPDDNSQKPTSNPNTNSSMGNHMNSGMGNRSESSMGSEATRARLEALWARALQRERESIIPIVGMGTDVGVRVQFGNTENIGKKDVGKKMRPQTANVIRRERRPSTKDSNLYNYDLPDQHTNSSTRASHAKVDDMATTSRPPKPNTPVNNSMSGATNGEVITNTRPQPHVDLRRWEPESYVHSYAGPGPRHANTSAGHTDLSTMKTSGDDNYRGTAVNAKRPMSAKASTYDSRAEHTRNIANSGNNPSGARRPMSAAPVRRNIPENGFSQPLSPSNRASRVDSSNHDTISETTRSPYPPTPSNTNPKTNQHFPRDRDNIPGTTDHTHANMGTGSAIRTPSPRNAPSSAFKFQDLRINTQRDNNSKMASSMDNNRSPNHAPGPYSPNNARNGVSTPIHDTQNRTPRNNPQDTFQRKFFPRPGSPTAQDHEHSSQSQYQSSQYQSSQLPMQPPQRTRPMLRPHSAHVSSIKRNVAVSTSASTTSASVPTVPGNAPAEPVNVPSPLPATGADPGAETRVFQDEISVKIVGRQVPSGSDSIVVDNHRGRSRPIQGGLDDVDDDIGASQSDAATASDTNVALGPNATESDATNAAEVDASGARRDYTNVRRNGSESGRKGVSVDMLHDPKSAKVENNPRKASYSGSDDSRATSGNSCASESSSVPPSSAAAAAQAYGTQGSASLHSGKSLRPKITVAQKNIDVAREKSHQKLGAMLLNARSREYERLLAEEERIRMEKQRQDLVKEKKKQDMIRFRLATEMIQGKNKR